MYSKAFLKTGGTVLALRGKSNPRTNQSKYMSTIINNRSITTNDSSGINYSKINNFNNNIYKLKKNFKVNKNSRSFNYVPLNTIATGESTWYHTKTVSSLNKEKKQLLEDADIILKERIQNNLGGVSMDRKKGKILEKSRELCLNNYMITQLKDKRTEINRKEFFIEMALKKSEKQYEIDYRSFIDFVEEIKKKEKKEEELLNKVKSKKDSTELILIEEVNLNKKLEEKCENIIKNIVLLKNYGSFIHKVFKTPFIFDELSNDKLIGKKYINLRSKIISIYDKNKLNNNINQEEVDYILSSDESLMRQYNNYEQKLVRILEDKNYLDKEINNMINKVKIELELLNQKLKDSEKEYEKIKLDKKRMLNSMKEFQTNNVSEIEEYFKYIVELGKEIGIDSPKSNINKNNSITEYLYYCKDTLSNLEQKEILINEYIKEIENIIENGDENDRSIIEELLLDRKRLIKKEKQILLKKQQDDYDRKRKLKAIERAKRIVIKGRKVFEDIPPWKNKKKNIIKNDNNDNKDEQYLYYSDDNNY